MDIDTALIGGRVKAARIAKKMTQEQLADRLGFVTTDSVGHIERGRNKPSLKTMIHMAVIFEVSLDYLVGLVEDPHETVIAEVATEEKLTDEQAKLLREMAKSMIPFVKRISK